MGFYNASKHAFGAVTDGPAMEVGPFGIGVQCIELGGYATETVADADVSVEDSSPYDADHRWVVDVAARITTGDPAYAAQRIVDAQIEAYNMNRDV
jgi:NAD(P)-dependent dehydrogenase (short-subunit alcohol dehydrogenase family)